MHPLGHGVVLINYAFTIIIMTHIPEANDKIRYVNMDNLIYNNIYNRIYVVYVIKFVSRSELAYRQQTNIDAA